MYSVMIARYKYFPEVKTKGMSAAPRLVLFTSEHVRLKPSLYNSTCITKFEYVRVNPAWTDWSNVASCRATIPSRRPVQLWASGQRTWSFWAQIRGLLPTEPTSLVEYQIPRFIYNCFLLLLHLLLLLLQRASHSCRSGSKSNRGQAEGKCQQLCLRHGALCISDSMQWETPWSMEFTRTKGHTCVCQSSEDCSVRLMHLSAHMWCSLGLK